MNLIHKIICCCFSKKIQNGFSFFCGFKRKHYVLLSDLEKKIRFRRKDNILPPDLFSFLIVMHTDRHIPFHTCTFYMINTEILHD